MSEKKGIIQEFKEFINQGNVMDLAVGVIIGAAFKAIVDSLVGDLISPIIGSIFKMDFSDLSVNINGAELMYGNFIMSVLNFFIIAIVLFCIIKAFNKARNAVKKPVEEAPAAPETKVCPFCKSEIAIDACRCPHCTSEIKD
ncbi:MAG: large conductance mechanosensitive channel protein MscL [Parasporobacterium sp.]|nr:large conductance mechanosensitive channel protein MscL [Parasporobacterium sp.]